MLLAELLGGGADEAAEARRVAHLLVVGNGPARLGEGRAAGAGGRAAADRRVYPRVLARRSAMRVGRRLALLA